MSGGQKQGLREMLGPTLDKMKLLRLTCVAVTSCSKYIKNTGCLVKCEFHRNKGYDVSITLLGYANTKKFLLHTWNPNVSGHPVFDLTALPGAEVCGLPASLISCFLTAAP